MTSTQILDARLSQWSSYMAEIEEFFEVHELGCIGFTLSSYGNYSFNFLVQGELNMLWSSLKSIALSHGQPLICVAPHLVKDEFDDAVFHDCHATYIVTE